MLRSPNLGVAPFVPGSLISTSSLSETGAVQNVTVPTGAYYAIATVQGAAGAAGYDSIAGGNGDYLVGTFPVTAGQLLQVVVGSTGNDAGSQAGGGGGLSGIFSGTPSASTAIMIAGGGGGGGNGFKGGSGNGGNGGLSPVAAPVAGEAGGNGYGGDGGVTSGTPGATAYGAGSTSGSGHGGYGGGGAGSVNSGGGGGGRILSPRWSLLSLVNGTEPERTGGRCMLRGDAL
jgi:loricrin